MKDVRNGAVIAKGDATRVIQGNHYFPTQLDRSEVLQGQQNQDRVSVEERSVALNAHNQRYQERGRGLALQEPRQAAAKIKRYIAFWRDVEVTE